MGFACGPEHPISKRLYHIRNLIVCWRFSKCAIPYKPLSEKNLFCCIGEQQSADQPVHPRSLTNVFSFILLIITESGGAL